MNIVFENDILTKFFDCFLDVSNSTETKTLNVHKIILANKSVFFEKLFEKEHGPKYTISVSFAIDTFEKYLNFLYTGHIEKRTDINDYINTMLMYSYFELLEELKILIFELIEYVEEQYHLHSNSEECETICQFLEDHDVLTPTQKENLFARIGYMIGKNKLFDSGINKEKRNVFITQRQDGKYTDFDAEQFTYNNLVFNADCAAPLERDWKGNIIRTTALPHKNLKECTFRIVSWPLICEPVPKETKVALAATTRGIRQTRETIDYRWNTYQAFEKNKVCITGKVYLDIINGFDKPMRFKVPREKNTHLTFPRALVHAGTNEIDAIGDSLYFHEKHGYNIYRNTLYRFVVIFD